MSAQHKSNALEALNTAETTWEAADYAADYVMAVLMEALGVKDVTFSDGSETWEGDVAGTVYNILRAAQVLDDDHAVARHHATEAR